MRYCDSFILELLILGKMNKVTSAGFEKKEHGTGINNIYDTKIDNGFYHLLVT